MAAATKKAAALGDAIDTLYGYDREIKKAERAVKGLKSKRYAAEADLLKAMGDVKLAKAAGRKAQASVSRRNIPSIKDQLKFQKYVKKNNAFDLYQNRISSKAYFARLDDGDEVPGIKMFEKVSVSIRKRG